jgi:hypothetical protein
MKNPTLEITCTFKILAEVDPSNYGKNKILTTQEMIEEEKRIFTEDPERILNFIWDSYEVEVKEV